MIVTIKGTFKSFVPDVIYESFILPTFNSFSTTLNAKLLRTPSTTSATQSSTSHPLIITKSAQKALNKDFQDRVNAIEQNDDNDVWNDYERDHHISTPLLHLLESIVKKSEDKRNSKHNFRSDRCI
jgi:hypothetical protein